MIKYDEYKDQMQTGDLLLCRGFNPLGAAIQVIKNESISHAAMILRLKEYEGIEGRRYYTGADGHGTNIQVLSRYLRAYNGEIFWYPLRSCYDHMRQEIGNRLMEMIGIDYGDMKLVQMIGGLKIEELQKDQVPETLICSEYIAMCMGIKGTVPTPAQLPGYGYWSEPIQITFAEESVLSEADEFKKRDF